MATFISDTLGLIDNAIISYAEIIFSSFAGPVTGAIQAMGFAGLALVAANSLFQFYAIRMSEYIQWGVRYVVILAVATSWSQFLPIYDIITNVPSSIAASLLTVTSAPSLNFALDEMVTNTFQVGDEIRSRAGNLDFGMMLASIIMWGLGAVMATVAIIVSAVAKIGLAMAVSLAPAFIPALLFRATSDLFTTWSRFTIGFALIPVVLAGVMGAVVGVGQMLLVEPTAMATLSDAAGFLIVVLASIIMMAQIPTMVNGLAGGIVATAGGLREMQTAGEVAVGAKNRTVPQVQRAASVVAAGMSAQGGPKERVAAMLDDYRTTKALMHDNARRYQDRASHFGRQTSWAERSEARRAGLQKAIRDQGTKRNATLERLRTEVPPEPKPGPEALKRRGKLVS